MFGEHGKGKGELNRPQGIAVDSNGRVYVCEHRNHRVSVFTLEGKFMKSFGSRGRRTRTIKRTSSASSGQWSHIRV